MSSVAVVVVNYASHDLLLRNLASTAGTEDVDVVVVDSWSSLAERESVRALTQERGWHLVEPRFNVGFGAGVNLGVTRCRDLGFDVIVLLNPDLELTPEGLARLARRVQNERDLVVAPQIRRPDGSGYALSTMDLLLHDGTMRSSSRRRSDDHQPFEEWVSGACLAFDIELWVRAGGFAEDYFLYWEDVDFSRRVRACGARLEIDTSIVAWHAEGGTQRRHSERAKSADYYYYNIRNRLLYASSWLDDRTQARWRRTVVRQASLIVLQGGRRQLVQSVDPWRAAARGVLDGLRLRRGPRRPPGEGAQAG